MALKNAASGYDSAFEEDEKLRKKQQERHALFNRNRGPRGGLPSKLLLADAASQDEGKRRRYQMSNLTAYERHKMLINEYILYHPGSTNSLQRDTSKDKRDIDVIRENHQFLWDASDAPDTWERQLAKKYFDKLFKEYCICDLSRYKENKVGMRWRIEVEVIDGKGQFTCGERRCSETEGLRTWEMNFGYIEQEVKKNALVKLRLCHDCSYKVNYHHKRKEVTRKRTKSNADKHRNKKKQRKEEDETAKEETQSTEPEKETTEKEGEKDSEDSVWKGPAKVEEEKSREEEFEEYLQDLFL
ncbi:protein FRA10AC1 homolog [Penaeus chinensis]|uniref:protein FRA10AC1 homolog n=1 Tax=Penaeus chinensis TaxID=139456 RepID=UPI001FB5E838|nr:protein FRA10AC1 homolog [Penaeus chinensis]